MFRSLAVIGLCAALSFTITSCDDDDAQSNQITYGTTTTSISEVLIMKAPEPDASADGGSHYQHALALLGEGLSWNNDQLTGSGTFLAINPNSPTSGLAAGTYTYTYTDEWNDKSANELRSAYLYVGYKIGEEPEAAYVVTSGTLNVSVNGDSYTISFSGTAYPPLDGTEDSEPDTTKPSISVSAHYTGAFRLANPA